MEKLWLKHYPKGVPESINTEGCENINVLIQQTINKYKDKTAFSNFGSKISFKELEQYSDEFASFLQNELQLLPGDRIALQLPNIMQYPIALFGSLKAGLVVVNTNPLYTKTEMAHQFKDSGAKAIVIFANFADKLEAVPPRNQY